MINISIVAYQTNFQELKNLIEICKISSSVESIFVIDNSEKDILGKRLKKLSSNKIIYIKNSTNLGYGAGHNVAIKRSLASSKIDYHLVINSDINFESKILTDIKKYMDIHQEAGMMVPKVLFPNGEIQYNCKLLPNPFTIILRFILASKNRRFIDYRYQLEKSGYDKIFSSPSVSGCFMFLRCKDIEKVGLFDERYFMYAEDVDLSRRMRKKKKIVFNPEFQIFHEFKGESHKKIRMFLFHVMSIVKYFNKWGWVFDSERKVLNKATLNQFKNKI